MAEPKASAQTHFGLTEQWFVNHGLPYFVDQTRADVETQLNRTWPLVLVLAATCSALGVALAHWWVADRFAWIVASQIFLVCVGVYAVTSLRAGGILRWALRQAFGSIASLFPLVTRALPMLLLFVTFLFINTEVWQVSAQLDGGVMWGTVLLFAAVAVGFLLARLPEEVQVLDDELDAAAMVKGCHQTPLSDASQELLATPTSEVQQAAELDRLQRINLLLVLLVTQLIQVLVLSAAMFSFFVVFGALAMHPSVLNEWIGEPLNPLLGTERLSRELVQVAGFLSAFSGLYFTVYAVTDATYRRQFFSTVLAELDQSVCLRAAYRLLRHQ
jgi:hypothetical protein